MGVTLGKHQLCSFHNEFFDMACSLTTASPGRWFVAHQLKLLLAYIALNYDMQPLESRPPNRIFGDSIVPSSTATISVRRRKGMSEMKLKT